VNLQSNIERKTNPVTQGQAKRVGLRDEIAREPGCSVVRLLRLPDQSKR
jgi:hypothetical protein